MNRSDGSDKRIKFLEKLADLSTIIGATYIGKSISSKSKLDKDMLDAAYEVADNGGVIDDSIESASNKEHIGEAVALASAILAYKGKMPMKVAIPVAVSALGLASSYASEAQKYKRLKGKKIMLDGMKDLK